MNDIWVVGAAASVASVIVAAVGLIDENSRKEMITYFTTCVLIAVISFIASI